ncbi:MAG: SAM-dependent methyltransferase [Gammaproteobacteria bacterium]
MWEADRLWEMWGKLADAVRTGRPQMAVNQQQKAEEFFPTLVRSLHIQNRDKAQTLARRLTAGRKGLRGIDVACGSGVWGIAVCEADPEARFVAQGFPAVLDLTRQYVRQQGVGDRYEFLPGNLREVDFGRDRFDLALLGNIVHSEGEASSRDLFRRLHAALRPGGRIVIVDMLPNDARTGPEFPLFFALNMLLATEEGGTYTLAEYTEWLCQAGFHTVETTVEMMDVGGHSPAVIATKA